MGTATADPSTDLELTNMEELEFEPPCDGLPIIAPCDRAATWQALLSCSHTRLWCDDHKDRVLGIIGDNVNGEFTCLNCSHGGDKRGKTSQVKILVLESRKRA